MPVHICFWFYWNNRLVLLVRMLLVVSGCLVSVIITHWLWIIDGDLLVDNSIFLVLNHGGLLLILVIGMINACDGRLVVFGHDEQKQNPFLLGLWWSSGCSRTEWAKNKNPFLLGLWWLTIKMKPTVRISWWVKKWELIHHKYFDTKLYCCYNKALV